MDILGTVFFAAAVLHTFLVGRIRRFAHRFPEGSALHGIFHFLGEVEAVFGIWAAGLMLLMAGIDGVAPTAAYLDDVKFTEPLFVFAIMALCSTRPVLEACRSAIVSVSRFLNQFLKTPERPTEIFVVLTLGPLAGSLITEPAAMTVTALLLLSMVHTRRPRTLYALLGVLFVNVSIGGALTPYAAPPILMVAAKWGWTPGFVFEHLGWKAAVAVVANSLGFVFCFRRSLGEEFYTLKHLDAKEGRARAGVPWAVTAVHFLFLAGVIVSAHHEKIFMALFVFYLGVMKITARHQDGIRLKDSLLVAFFLAGIVTFGPFQTWWLQPLLASLGDGLLFLSATALTAVTDNAALTFLGSQVLGLSDESKYAMVAGALAGGGLTIIANAPNPAGASILQEKFPGNQISAGGLLLGALAPTAVAVGCLWLLP